MAKKSRKVGAPPGAKRRGSSGAMWWVGIVAVAVVGVLLVVLSRGDRPEIDKSAGTPVGGHSHAVYGVYACGQWVLPHAPEIRPLPDPHTHADSLIHSEPLSNASAYVNATLGRYADVNGWSVSATKLDLWNGDEYENGDECETLDGREGVVQWSLNGEVHSTDPAEYIIEDGDVLTLAFMPEGDEFPTLPPWAADALASNSSPINHPDAVASDDVVPQTPEGHDAPQADDGAGSGGEESGDS